MRSDEEIVKTVLDGDRTAFAVLVERYERPVRVVATDILHDLSAARDVAQETFVTAYEKLGTLRDGGAFGSWIQKIARHEALRVVRKQVQMVPLGDETAPGTADHDGRLDETLERVLAAVTRLPDHERRVIMLKHFEGYSVREVADMTRRPLGTVTKQMSRAYARLRKHLKEMKP